jgi:hypothetical protein
MIVMKRHHRIEKVSFVEVTMLLGVDGKEYKLRLRDISKRLAKASTRERQKFEVSPAGYGIHWPLIDEDLSIDGLIGVKHKKSRPKESVSA